MFLCEILTEQQQALPKAPKPPPQHIHVPVQQPAPPKEKKEPAQQVEPVQAAPEQTPYDVGDEYDPELDGAVEEVLPFQEILPMKRYYLIGRLRELKSRLDQNNIQNEDFDIIVKFTNNLSYGSLVSLASGIIPVVEEQLARLTTNAQ